MGRIMQFLKENNMLENTMVIFTSDNGGLGMDELGPTPTSNRPLRKWKGHVYEGGIRVPALISWQGKIKPGRISDEYFSSVDYFTTLCEMAAIKKLPVNIDGISILPALFGTGRIDAGRPLFWHYPHFSNQMGRPAGAVRLGDYKLVENYETGELELYNLKEDISESRNLSSSMNQKTAELHKLLVNWRKSINASMPVPNPEFNKQEVSAR